MGRGPTYTEAEKTAIWDQRAEGASLNAIARGVGRSFEGVRHQIKLTGGVRPARRQRAARALTAAEREEISRGLASGDGYRTIASRLGRAHTSVSREVKRNGGRKRYRAGEAEAAALRRSCRPKQTKLELCPQLQVEVVARLKLEWSPEQISASLRLDFPGQPEMQISHETIYLCLYIQSRGALKKELTSHLRKRRLVRQAKKHLPGDRFHASDRVMISERPAEVADRAVPGHWEGDLLLGKPTDGIGTLVERTSRYVMLFLLPPRITAESVRDGLARTILTLPASLRRSLTWDQGREMAEHLRFTVESGVQIYFCDPGSPWQRGTNENTNGLLRQYFPKAKTMAGVTEADLVRVADRLNGRPRQTLGWKTPAFRLAEILAESESAGGATTP